MSAPQTRPAAGSGEAPGRCTWAGCTRPAVTVEDGWPMCRPCHRLHFALLGQPYPRDRVKVTTAPQDRERLLRELHAQGKNDVEIGLLMGVHRTLIGKRRRELGLPAVLSRRDHEDRKRMVRELHALGRNDIEIGEVLGVGSTIVGEYRRELGLPRVRRPRPINHGSAGGAAAHYRRGEKPCRPCLDAQAQDKSYVRPARPRSERKGEAA